MQSIGANRSTASNPLPPIRILASRSRGSRRRKPMWPDAHQAGASALAMVWMVFTKLSGLIERQFNVYTA